MDVGLVDEAYSSQTCPQCGERHKPRGRVFACPACGLRSHRDAVGAVNLLSRYTTGQVGQVGPPGRIKYRHPFGKLSVRTGKRSAEDTGPGSAVSVSTGLVPVAQAPLRDKS